MATTLAPPETTIAIYARFSCDKQSETSLEDQIRRCKELATMNGLSHAEVLIYQDAAISGTGNADQREGYSQMKADWAAAKFNVLLVDEFSRLSRNRVEQANLEDLIDNNPRLRLITGDGIDTRGQEWQLRLGLQGVLAQHESRKLRYRVERGMVGQLERGYMLAYPPFGYRRQHDYDTNDRNKGTLWSIDEPTAAIVRQVFERRYAGDSMHQIATWLNQTGIACSRQARTVEGGHWRASRVKILLANNIYRGVFVWHGSTTYQDRCKKKGLTVETKEYARPQLRLVSDEVWMACNSKTISRSGYGGGSHALTGLLHCGCCGGILALTSATKPSRSAYCPDCTERKSSKQQENLQTCSILLTAVQLMLTHAVQHFISDPHLSTHRQTLELLLQGDRSADIEKCQAQLKKLEAAQQRLARMLTRVEADDAVLEQRYTETKAQMTQLREHIAQLQGGEQPIDTAAIQAQLQVDLQPLLKQLFDTTQSPQALRAQLARLLPSVVFEGKSPDSRYISHFRVKFCLGTALAIASGTPLVAPCELQARFMLQYKQATGKGIKTPAAWSVQTVETITAVAPAALEESDMPKPLSS